MIITTIEQIRSASSINVSNTIENWLPYLEDAEFLFIKPLIGPGLYAAVLAYINQHHSNAASVGENDPPDDPIIDELLGYVRKALALYALYSGIDEFSVSVSSAGVQEIQSTTHKAAPQYKILNLKEVYISRAHRYADEVLNLMDQNKEYFSQYSDIPCSNTFIRNADEFQAHCDIHHSRRVFLAMVPIMVGIEKRFILPTLSPELYAQFKDHYLAGNLDNDEIDLLVMIQPALAHLSLARALVEISIDTLDWGVFNDAHNTFSSIQSKSLANADRISAMEKSNTQDGEAELKALQQYLDNNASATKYPLYFHSSRYLGPENAIKRNEFINTTDNAFFVV